MVKEVEQGTSAIRKIWRKIFETKHTKCVFDIETNDGVIYKNADYSQVFLSTQPPQPFQRKVAKMTFHCHNCIDKCCSHRGKKDYSITSDKD